MLGRNAMETPLVVLEYLLDVWFLTSLRQQKVLLVRLAIGILLPEKVFLRDTRFGQVASGLDNIWFGIWTSLGSRSNVMRDSITLVFALPTSRPK